MRSPLSQTARCSRIDLVLKKLTALLEGPKAARGNSLEHLHDHGSPIFRVAAMINTVCFPDVLQRAKRKIGLYVPDVLQLAR